MANIHFPIFSYGFPLVFLWFYQAGYSLRLKDPVHLPEFDHWSTQWSIGQHLCALPQVRESSPATAGMVIENGEVIK